jgi:predicted DNA-binding transcriptional regulator AlpA
LNADLQTLEPLLLNAAAAAKMLSISRSAFYSKVSAGLIPPAVYIGESPRWIVSELKSWTENRCPSAEQWEAMQAQEARR